ncbi:MAG: Rab family GTPase [Planctomycetota bacterium]
MRLFKVCMLGAYAVGKTSLVARYVQGVFSERYQTTIGVKIDRKDVEVGSETARLVLWDINGEDRFLKVQPSYVRGAAGCLFVIDGTRAATLETVEGLRDMVRTHVGDVPSLCLVNKADVQDQWELSLAEVHGALAPTGVVLATSAKTGEGVEVAFTELAQRILAEN